ncbi:MAG: M1 family metallopeptidase [Saprospiraceae bacterium]|nr:M1 family metallopeptidase [Saprospiraceae bacterium]
MNTKYLLLLLLVAPIFLSAQNTFTRQDTLRGTITPERSWWDLTYYHLQVEVNPSDSSLQGINTMQFKVLEAGNKVQIDLQPPMEIDKVMFQEKEVKVIKEGNAHFIDLPAGLEVSSVHELDIYFQGKPKVSKRPPWDGGLTWQKDLNGKDIVTTTCQGDGASLWWPCKDHMYDEVDSMLISVKVPEGLMDVSNGRLRATDEHEDGSKTFHWFVSNPISNYVINLNVSDYVQFSEQYEGVNGTLDCDYFVLPYNLEKAQEQFKDVGRMLEAFEHWFGPYPFYEDGFKLVEVPYPGMEHQSSVTYGNGFENGYGGRDVSGTGWGFKFDFIIIHEAGHEWFANSITYKDIADMWIHESFTAYSEGLFVDFHYGKEAGAEYVVGTRQNIRNDRPIIGSYGVNHSGSGDMYSKGANMLHTLRQWVNNDGKWRQALRGLNKTFYHQTVSTQQIEDYLAEKLGLELKVFFDQYLRTTDIPVLEYKVEESKLKYRWTNCLKEFAMPIKVKIGEQYRWLMPRTTWTTHLLGEGEGDSILVDSDFYIEAKRLEKG